PKLRLIGSTGADGLSRRRHGELRLQRAQSFAPDRRRAFRIDCFGHRICSQRPGSPDPVRQWRAHHLRVRRPLAPQFACHGHGIGKLISQTSDIAHIENGRSLTDLGTLGYGGAAGASGRNGRATAEPGPHALSQLLTSTNSTGYTYDADGNITQKDGGTLTWD